MSKLFTQQTIISLFKIFIVDGDKLFIYFQGFQVCWIEIVISFGFYFDTFSIFTLFSELERLQYEKK
jgi:hypothetical protein